MFYIHARCKYHLSQAFRQEGDKRELHLNKVPLGYCGKWLVGTRCKVEAQPRTLIPGLAPESKTGALPSGTFWSITPCSMLETVRAPDAGKKQRDEAGRPEQASRLGAFISGLSVEYGWKATATTDASHPSFPWVWEFWKWKLVCGDSLKHRNLGRMQGERRMEQMLGACCISGQAWPCFFPVLTSRRDTFAWRQLVPQSF